MAGYQPRVLKKKKKKKKKTRPISSILDRSTMVNKWFIVWLHCLAELQRDITLAKWPILADRRVGQIAKWDKPVLLASKHQQLPSNDCSTIVSLSIIDWPPCQLLSKRSSRHALLRRRYLALLGRNIGLCLHIYIVPFKSYSFLAENFVKIFIIYASVAIC